MPASAPHARAPAHGHPPARRWARRARHATAIAVIAVLASWLVAVATASAADPWSNVGTPLNVNAANSVSDTSSTTVGTTPHVAYIENGNVFVKRWNGASWVQDGASRLNATAGASQWVDTTTDGTNVIVAWTETVAGFDNLFVKRWNGASWTALGASLNISTSRTAYQPSVAVVNGTLSITWNEDTASDVDVYVKQWNGASWVSVGGVVEPTSTSYVWESSITGDASNLYVALTVWDGTNYDVWVRRWTGAAWATVGGTSINAVATANAWHLEAIMQGTSLVVAWAEENNSFCSCRIYVKQWTGAAWTQLGSFANHGGNAISYRHDMIPGVSGPWIAYRSNTSPNTIRLANWTGSAWRPYGGSINQRHRAASHPSVVLVSGTPWVAFGEEDESAVKQLAVRRWNPTFTMVGNISNFNVTAASGQTGFTWTNPPDANYDGVDIYRSTISGQLGTLQATVAPPAASWSQNGLTDGTRYFYTFVPHNSAGDRRETVYDTADSQITPARYVGTLESDGADVYSFGGYEDSVGLRNDIWKFNGASTATTKLASTLSAPRSNVGAAWVGGSVNRIVLMGGEDGVGPATNAIQRFDPATGTIATAGATMPAARATGGIAYSPDTGRVYYLGGSTTRWVGGTISNQILWYDPVAGTTGTLGTTLPQPMARTNAAYWPGDKCIYMFGGHTTGDVDSDKIVRFCPLTGTATNMAQTLPIPMSEIAVSRGSRGIVLLGASAAAYQQPIYEFDPFERAFLQHPIPMRMPYAQATNAISTAIDDVIYTGDPWFQSSKVTQVNLGVVVDVTPSNPPVTPTNVAPASSAVVATASPTLTSSAFSDPDVGASHFASHWQLRTYAGTYAAPLIDSQLDITNLTSFTATGLVDGGRYCWHVRHRDQNRVFSAWSSETCFWVDTAPQNPVAAASLEQYRANGTTVIASGGFTTDGVSTNVVLKFDMSDPDGSQTLTPWVEVRPNATGFSTACGTTLAGVMFSGAAIALPNPGAVVTASVNVTGLTAGTTYHWRACARDNTARSGSYTNKGASPDFRVVADQLPTAAPSTPLAGATGSDTTPNLVATFTDPDATDTGTIDVEVCTSNPTPAQTCTGIGGTLAANGATPSGIANGSTGTWTVSPALALGTYWWRVRARDKYDLEGAWSAGRQLIVGTPSLTIGVDSGTKSLGTMLAGTDVTATSVITVTSNNASGYTLDATDASNTGSASCSAGACAGLWMPDWSGTSATPTTWAAGSAGAGGWFGVTVLSVTGTTTTKLAKWGTGTTATDFANNKYAGLTTSASTLHSTSSYFSGSDTITTAYRAIASTSTVAGSYSATISYSVVANP
jgi:hypothetical protein